VVSVAVKPQRSDEQKLAATPAKELEIDQDQCQRLKDYYGVNCPKGLRLGSTVLAVIRLRTAVAITLPGGVRRGRQRPEYSTQIYEMMERLGIEPGAGLLPQLSLRYATALRRCENCRSKKACQNWLDYAPAMVNFAPDFCMNADILVERAN
jgi:hypothetical protein